MVELHFMRLRRFFIWFRHNDIYIALPFVIRRKSDLTVTIGSSERGVYEVLLQNRGNAALMMCFLG